MFTMIFHTQKELRVTVHCSNFPIYQFISYVSELITMGTAEYRTVTVVS